VVISAISGTAGIGKTTLAVHWAYQVADRFPDGQLYVNLRGFDPSGSPMGPAEAVRGFLDAFEVPAERIPLSVEAQAALFRSLLAGRRVLVVLDNARDTDQVRSLLPGSPGCMAVVTSRDSLISLIAAGNAHPVILDLLTTDEAYHLLARRLGEERVAAEPQAVKAIIASCARLPLALSVVAARAATHPGFPLTALAAELRDSQRPLAPFGENETITSAQAVFSWSYSQLSQEGARLFRLLGLHPGPDITPPAAASLAGGPAAAVRPMLTELARAHLITEHVPGRYTFHDLLRGYAAELADKRDGEIERSIAVRQTLDHYLHTAHAAALRLHSAIYGTIVLAKPSAEVTPEGVASHEQAWAWFEAEYAVLLAAVRLASAAALPTHAWQLAWTLVPFFERRGYWHDWVAAHRCALSAAEQADDQRGQAYALRGLGRACCWLGRFEEAKAQFMHALALFEQLGDRVGQADTHYDLSHTLDHQGCPGEALPHDRQALAFYRSTEQRIGLAKTLNGLGWLHAQLGDDGQALRYCEEALVLFRELENRSGEAHTLDSLGYAHHHLGNHQRAIAYYQQALALMRDLRDHHSEATVLAHLGDVNHVVADIRAACDAWRRALEIIDHLDIPSAGLGHPNADRIRAKLAQLGAPGPGLSSSPAAASAVEPALTTPIAGKPTSGPSDVPVGHVLGPPAGTRVFTGRARELSRLLEQVPGEPPPGPLLMVVTGMGGVGKTELAIRAAQELASRYPDGQFWVGLRTYAPAAESRIGVTAALRTLLNAAGAAPDPHAASAAALSQKWRSVTADRKILLVLDDADDASQVRSLLPAAQGCAVLVTSRHVLTGLDPDRTIALDVFGEDEARELADEILRRARQQDPGVARAIAAACRLPLAVRQMTDFKAAHPDLDLAEVTAMTSQDSDAAAGARELSFSRLTQDAQLMLRRIAHYPGSLITRAIAATMADQPLTCSSQLLAELFEHGLLIAEPNNGYRMHDLVRAAALRESDACDSTSQLAACHDRLFRYIDACIVQAVWMIYRGDSVTGMAGGMPDRPDVPPPCHDSDMAAWSWLDQHQADLLAVARRCISQRSKRAWHLVYDLEFYQRIRGFYSEIAELHSSTLRLAQDSKDRLGQAAMHQNLGLIDMRTSNYPAARIRFEAALALYTEVGNQIGQSEIPHEMSHIDRWLGNLPAARAHAQASLSLDARNGEPIALASAHADLGRIDRIEGHHRSARQHLATSLQIFEDIGQRRGIAIARHELGLLDSQTNRHDDARTHLEYALAMFQELGDLMNQADAHHALAVLGRRTGSAASAHAHAATALRISSEISHYHGQAEAHTELGMLAQLDGNAKAVRLHWQEALVLYQRLGMPAKANDIQQLLQS
jgi:tetratricopeptide (TPR) repeat protein